MGRGRKPIKLYLQNQEASRIWPLGHGPPVFTLPHHPVVFSPGPERVALTHSQGTEPPKGSTPSPLPALGVSPATDDPDLHTHTRTVSATHQCAPIPPHEETLSNNSAAAQAGRARTTALTERPRPSGKPSVPLQRNPQTFGRAGRQQLPLPGHSALPQLALLGRFCRSGHRTSAVVTTCPGLRTPPGAGIRAQSCSTQLSFTLKSVTAARPLNPCRLSAPPAQPLRRTTPQRTAPRHGRSGLLWTNDAAHSRHGWVLVEDGAPAIWHLRGRCPT